jgi:cell wall-associated NlpC family hydrolase
MESFLAVARSWIDTPWSHQGACKGKDGGVDCVGFPYAVFSELGYELPELPNYDRNPKGEQLLHHLDRYAKVLGVIAESFSWSDRYEGKIIDRSSLLEQLQPGDIMVYSAKYQCPPRHLALRTEIGKIHATWRHGVREVSLGEELLLCAAYRIF